MRTQQEQELKNVMDYRMMSRLAVYAKPYWRMILLCIIMVLIIVVADLARVYVIKVSIDDYIKGVSKPMLSTALDEADELSALGKVMEVDGVAYVRVSDDVDLTANIQARQKQIVEVDEQYVLIDGWLPRSQLSPTLAYAEGQPLVSVGDETFAGELLSRDVYDAFRQYDISGFIMLGIIFLLIITIAALLNYVQTNLLQYTGQRIIFNIREQMFHHLSRMSMSFFDRNPVGRLVVRLTSDTEAVNQLYSQVIVNLVKDIVVLIGIVVVMLHLSVKLTLLTFLVVPILGVITFWFRLVVRRVQRRTRVLLAVLNSFLAENLSGMRITQLFTREKWQIAQFEEHNQAYYRAGMKGTTINSIFQPAIGFFGNLSIALLVWYGGISVIDGAITFGIVFAFTQYVTMFFRPLMSLAERYNQIQTAMVGAERIFEMLDEVPEASVSVGEPRSLSADVKGEIRFENVWFAYNEPEWVLRDISFTIKPGQSVAFVGATGAGKSTIIQLINRFYEIQKGAITLDGIDIRTIPLDELRRWISIVQQDVFLFTGDIASNINLHEERITREQVLAASKMVNMHDFVLKQPDQYETQLGERGVNLSLGQRQLLSFARAAAFKPQILILDEATSNIDTETELIVQEALHTMSQGRTTIIVAHRLSTIQHADQIIVMHKGQIRESGTHAELLAKRGYYYRLYELQYDTITEKSKNM